MSRRNSSFRVKPDVQDYDYGLSFLEKD